MSVTQNTLRVRRAVRSVAVLLGALALGLSAAVAQPKGPPHHAPDVVLVGFQPGASAADRVAARRAVGALRASPVSRLAPDAEVMNLPPGMAVDQAIKALMRSPAVRYAEPDYILQKAAGSNDPDYAGDRLWGMYGDATSPANAFGSQAGEAWAANRTGSRQVYVGVIDEGIDVTHPDLAANIWVNPFEIAGNGIDDDGNGFVDDVNGWDFVSNDNTVGDGADDDHGTHVAGTIGALGGNGAGVAGVNWQVTMISAKFLGTSGGTTANAVRAVDYITDLKIRHGLNIVATSNSWGGGGFSQTLLDAISRAGQRDILFIAAAGNSTSNNDLGGYYPSGYACATSSGWDCVVSVASITSSGAISSFSSYGATTVDLGAPGSDIRSTLPGGTYGNYSGTSMATPHVSGAAALCASIDPTQSGRELRAALVGSTAPTDSLAGKTATNGRLDIGTMMAVCVPPTQPVSGGPGSLTATAVSGARVRLDWVDGAVNETGFEIQRSPAGCGAFATIAQVAPDATGFDVANLTAGTEYCFRVRAISRYLVNGVPSTSAWTNQASATTLPPPPPYQCRPEGMSWIETTAGQALSMTDDSQASATLPFAFPFYGAPTTAIRIGSNGFVRFGTGTATAYANTPIPSSGDPDGFVAPFWDDLNPGVGGTVKTLVAGAGSARRFVVAWENVPHYSVAGSTLSFQVVLEEDTGHLVLNYRDVFAGNAAYDRGASATVGIEAADGLAGTQVSHNTATLADGTAYRCSTGAASTVGAPSNLQASAMSATQVSLAWTDNATNETGFIVERATGGGAFASVGTPAANATGFTDSGVSAGTTYSYRVKARNDAQTSAASNTATVTTPQSPPSAPSGLTAAALSPTQVSLAWTDTSSNETGFVVERSTGSGWSTVATPGANAQGATDATAMPGTAYTYRVTARNDAGSSAAVTASVATPQAPPSAPTGLSATAPSGTQVSLAWTDTSSNETGFRIERATGGGAFGVLATTGANVTGYSDTSVVSSTGYTYRVTAFNGEGNSASVTASVTTPAPPPTLPAAPGNVTAQTAVNDTTTVVVGWTDLSTNETSFQVGRQTRNARNGTWSSLTVVGTAGANVTAFSQSPGAGTFRYSVRAANAAGSSGWVLQTGTVTATKAGGKK